jgi:hypothetical protein
MEKTAKEVKGLIVVEQAYELEGTKWLVVRLDSRTVPLTEHGNVDYVAFKKLPGFVMYDGTVYGKSGFNSDSHRAYYKTGIAYATAVR